MPRARVPSDKRLQGFLAVVVSRREWSRSEKLFEDATGLLPGGWKQQEWSKDSNHARQTHGQLLPEAAFRRSSRAPPVLLRQPGCQPPFKPGELADPWFCVPASRRLALSEAACLFDCENVLTPSGIQVRCQRSMAHDRHSDEGPKLLTIQLFFTIVPSAERRMREDGMPPERQSYE